MALGIILLIAALVLFVIAIFAHPHRDRLVAAGLACWVGSQLVGSRTL